MSPSLEPREAMSSGKRTALITFAACLLAEALLDLAYQRWPPISFALGVGVGAGVWLLLIGRKADTYPWWYGIMLATSVSVGIVIARAIWGDSCALLRR